MVRLRGRMSRSGAGTFWLPRCAHDQPGPLEQRRECACAQCGGGGSVCVPCGLIPGPPSPLLSTLPPLSFVFLASDVTVNGPRVLVLRGGNGAAGEVERCGMTWRVCVGHGVDAGDVLHPARTHSRSGRTTEGVQWRRLITM